MQVNLSQSEQRRILFAFLISKVGPASDITAYRVYRVGGDFASYGWLADVDVSSSVPSNYDDSARIITSTSLTPLQYANPVPTASGKYLKHITNVSGIFLWSI